MRPETKTRRKYWILELEKLSGSFVDDTARMFNELQTEIKKEGAPALLDHLRVCGAMPERYGHDSSAEKLYSKYTDGVISEALACLGLKSSVISARADVADVHARAKTYSLVADAKAFRLSRTAKNQKDFKVQAMDGWRGDLDYAVVVCPIYQLPSRTSQIYQQAVARNVCILSYSHLAALVALTTIRSTAAAEAGLLRVLKSVASLHPSKNANDYWVGINRALVGALGSNVNLWTAEKTASLQGLAVVKEESLSYLRTEQNRLLGLSHKQALDELLQATGLKSRITQVEQIEHGNLLGV